MPEDGRFTTGSASVGAVVEAAFNPDATVEARAVVENIRARNTSHAANQAPTTRNTTHEASQSRPAPPAR